MILNTWISAVREILEKKCLKIFIQKGTGLSLKISQQKIGSVEIRFIELFFEIRFGSARFDAEIPHSVSSW